MVSAVIKKAKRWYRPLIVLLFHAGSFRGVRLEALDHLPGHGDGLEAGPRYARENDMAFSYQIAFAFLVHLEAQRERFVPKSPDKRRDFYEVVQHQRLFEIEVDLHSWKPDIEAIKEVLIRQPYFAKQ